MTPTPTTSKLQRQITSSCPQAQQLEKKKETKKESPPPLPTSQSWRGSFKIEPKKKTRIFRSTKIGSRQRRLVLPSLATVESLTFAVKQRLPPSEYSSSVYIFICSVKENKKWGRIRNNKNVYRR